MCAQVVSETALGFGTYTFELGSAVDNLDPNVVVGLYSWSDDPRYVGSSPWVNNTSNESPSHSELAIEFSKFGIPSSTTNADFVVQPSNVSGNLFNFLFPPGQNTSTQTINWNPTGLVFQSYDASGNLVQQWNYPGSVPPPADAGSWPGPVPAPQSPRINLWLLGGAPTNGQPAEVIVNKFTFTPAS